MDTEDRYRASLSTDGHARILIDAITDCAIYMLNVDGLVVSWNPGARRLKGYEAMEIIGESFSRFYTPDDLATDLPQRALRAAERDGRFAAEGWRVRKDGSRFWASVVIQPIYSPSGPLVGYAKITRDITSQHEAREALWQSEERFRLLVQGITDYAVYMLDRAGNIVTWNPGAERIKGYAAEEIIGRNFALLYTSAEREKGEPQAALETAAHEGRFETQAWRLRKDGTLLWANVVIDAIRNKAGEVIGFAKITRDLSGQHHVPAGLREPAPEPPTGRLVS
ncbi:PAS domain-containing protein [Xanthobacteraceae bacterium A53D]